MALLLRRRRQRTPAERVLGLTSTAFTLIPAVRTARTTYKVAKRLPVIVGGVAVGGIVFRQVRKSGASAGAPAAAAPYVPPAPTTTPTTGGPAADPSPVGTGGTGAPGPGGDAAATGTPPHGDPLGAAATGDLGAGDPTSTRHGLGASTGDTGDAGATETLPGVGPEPGPGGTSEIESGLGAVDITTPAVDTIHPDEVAGSKDLDLPATPGGADAANDALLGDLPPNESAPGHVFPDAPAEGDLHPPAGDADAPNESAPGHHPDATDKP